MPNIRDPQEKEELTDFNLIFAKILFLSLFLSVEASCVKLLLSFSQYILFRRQRTPLSGQQSSWSRPNILTRYRNSKDDCVAYEMEKYPHIDSLSPSM